MRLPVSPSSVLGVQRSLTSSSEDKFLPSRGEAWPCLLKEKGRALLSQLLHLPPRLTVRQRDPRVFLCLLTVAPIYTYQVLKHLSVKLSWIGDKRLLLLLFALPCCIGPKVDSVSEYIVQ